MKNNEDVQNLLNTPPETGSNPIIQPTGTVDTAPSLPQPTRKPEIVDTVISQTQTHKRNTNKTTTPKKQQPTIETHTRKGGDNPQPVIQLGKTVTSQAPGATRQNPLKSNDLPPSGPLGDINLAKLTHIGKNGAGQEIEDLDYAKQIAGAFCGKSIDEIALALSRHGTVEIERTKGAKSSGKAIQIEVKLKDNQTFTEGDITGIEFHPGGGTAHSYTKTDPTIEGDDKRVYKKKTDSSGDFELDGRKQKIGVPDDESGRYYRLHIHAPGKGPKGSRDTITIKVVDTRYRNSNDEYAKIVWVEGLGGAMPMEGIPAQQNVPRTFAPPLDPQIQDVPLDSVQTGNTPTTDIQTGLPEKEGGK